MRKAAIALAAASILLLMGQAAFASHGGPHCAKSQGRGANRGQQAGRSGQQCLYPPGQTKKATAKPKKAKNAKKASFQLDPERREGSITVGMLVLAGLGTFVVVVGGRTARRRFAS